MKKSDRVTFWIAAAGLFVTIIGSTSVLAFRIGGLNEKVISMERTLEDVPKIKIEIAEMQVKLDVLWRTHLSKTASSIKLNEQDIKALKTSGVENFTDRHYNEILLAVRALKPDNTREAQELLISVVNRYKRADDCSAMLREAAHSSGYDVDSLLAVAAVSLTDRVVSDLGLGD